MDNYTKRGTENRDEIEIDLWALFKAVWKGKWLVILVTLLFGILAFLYTQFLITPTYRTTLTAFVNNRAASANGSDSVDGLSSGDTSAAKQLTYTYASIISSRPILEEAALQAGLGNLPYSTLQKTVSASVQDNTQLVNLSVTMTDPENALKFAQAIATVAPDRLAEIVEGSSMKIVSYPTLPTRPNYPSKRRNTLLGMLLGAFLMVAYLVIRELLDTRVRSEQELEEKFGIPIIGTIPNFGSASGKGGYNYGYRKSQKKGSK